MAATWCIKMGKLLQEVLGKGQADVFLVTVQAF